jgi:hypothetical protein
MRLEDHLVVEFTGLLAPLEHHIRLPIPSSMRLFFHFFVIASVWSGI